MRFKTRVVRVSGTEYISDDGTEDVTEENLKELEEVFINMKKLNHLFIMKNGRKLYFNPDNIESIELIEVSK